MRDTKDINTAKDLHLCVGSLLSDPVVCYHTRWFVIGLGGLLSTQWLVTSELLGLAHDDTSSSALNLRRERDYSVFVGAIHVVKTNRDWKRNSLIKRTDMTN